jgi:hypothetical protein
VLLDCWLRDTTAPGWRKDGRREPFDGSAQKIAENGGNPILLLEDGGTAELPPPPPVYGFQNARQNSRGSPGAMGFVRFSTLPLSQLVLTVVQFPEFKLVLV